MIWDRKPEMPAVPDTACACVELARRDAIAEVRANLESALRQSVGDVSIEQWRRLAAKSVVRMRGL